MLVHTRSTQKHDAWLLKIQECKDNRQCLLHSAGEDMGTLAASVKNNSCQNLMLSLQREREQIWFNDIGRRVGRASAR